ncbi:peptidase family C54-domain-containing protein [Mycena galericulata]|nr:peptidase family C54-domain-containing protein [Mycena galericulata]
MDRLVQTPLTTVLSLSLPSPSFLYLFYFVSSSVGSTSSHDSASSHSQSASNYSYNTSTFSTSTSSDGGTKKKWWPSLAGMGGTKGWTSDAGACCRCRFYFFGLNARAACFMSFASTPLGVCGGAVVRAVDTPPSPPTRPPTRADAAAHARLLSWFLDEAATLFSVHRMVLAGKAAGKDVGMWFGPSAAAGAIWWVSNAASMLIDAFPSCGLDISIATDGMLYQTEVYAASHSPAALAALAAHPQHAPAHAHLASQSSSSPSGHSHGKHGKKGEKGGKARGWGDRPVLLLLGIQLGLDGVNPVYRETINVRLPPPSPAPFHLPLPPHRRRLPVPPPRVSALAVSLASSSFDTHGFSPKRVYLHAIALPPRIFTFRLTGAAIMPYNAADAHDVIEAINASESRHIPIGDSVGFMGAEGCAIFFLFTTITPRPALALLAGPSPTSPTAAMAKQNSVADLEFIDGLPTRDVKAFQDYMFTKPYITANPHLFIDTAWIDVAALRVKREFDASDVFPDTVKVKSESLAAPVAVRMRSAMEGGHEVIELLSDSDEEMSVPETRTSAVCMPSGSGGPDDSPIGNLLPQKKSRESTQRVERMAELQSMINDGKVPMKEHQDELKSLKGTSTRSTKTKSHKSTDGSIIISASSRGRVKTVPLPSKAKGVFVAANYFITVEFSLDVNSASAPGPDGNNLKYAVIDVDVPEDTEVLDSRDKDIPKSPAPTLAVTEHTNVIDIGVPEALAALESLAVPVAPAADPWEFFERPVEFSYPAPIPASDFSAFQMGFWETTRHFKFPAPLIQFLILIAFSNRPSPRSPSKALGLSPTLWIDL